MEIKEFSFNLPQHLIAQYPSDRRGESRLLVMDRKKGTLVDSSVSEIAQYLPEDSVLVINNSKVRKARVYGKSETGGNVEFLFLSMISPSRWIAMVSKSKRQKVGKSYLFELPEDHVTGTIVEETADGKIVEFDRDLDEWFFDTIGHVPLPPYIKRDDEFSDENRYQTVYASSSGSVAAPTAGLHFTESVLETIRRKNITIAPVTLH
ncbi:MAG: S-adenosylmethionine:tRNA ribosyltransferase-isomerase, partial [Sphaerochaetaceae bacterium]|nr:S-adenosylmethionine:tRNA ribosyltransferase-isomerase [Sphaerochaetaceae bacterium]